MEQCGRLWDLVTPRSASKNATVFDAIDEPRSACRVSCLGSTCCLRMLSAISRSARMWDSLEATIQPTG